MDRMTARERKAARKGRKLEFLRRQIRWAREDRRSEPMDVFFWGEGGQTKLKELTEEQLWEELVRARQGHAPFGLNEVQTVKRVDPPQEAQAQEDIPPLIECEITVRKPGVSPQEAQVPETVRKKARKTEKSAQDAPGKLQGHTGFLVVKEPQGEPQKRQEDRSVAKAMRPVQKSRGQEQKRQEGRTAAETTRPTKESEALGPKGQESCLMVEAVEPGKGLPVKAQKRQEGRFESEGKRGEDMQPDLRQARELVESLPDWLEQKELLGRVVRMFDGHTADEPGLAEELGELMKELRGLAELTATMSAASKGDRLAAETACPGKELQGLAEENGLDRRRGKNISVWKGMGVGDTRREYGCFYCWRPGHKKQDCLDLRADLKCGRCRLGLGRRVTWADGSEVEYERGRSLCERVRGKGRGSTMEAKSSKGPAGGAACFLEGVVYKGRFEPRSCAQAAGVRRTAGEANAVRSQASRGHKIEERRRKEITDSSRTRARKLMGEVEELREKVAELERRLEDRGREAQESVRPGEEPEGLREAEEPRRLKRESGCWVEELSADRPMEGGVKRLMNGQPVVRVETFAYKAVANKVRPVPTTMPEEMRIERIRHPNPLKGLPDLPVNPPDFTPGKRLTQERHDAMDWNPGNFLTDEEVKLVKYMAKAHEDAMAWDESEKGTFNEEYFPPVRIPTIEHVPWVLKNIPIPNGIREKVISIIKEKIASGIYEPSSASYRSRWFCVVKKDGKSLRLVHDLQPLNGVSIKDAAVPPFVDQLGESYAGRACYSSFDLYVAFDQRKLDVRSRDMTTFQTPMGTFRLTSIPIGYTNSMQILHNDVCFMLQEFIPEVTEPFVDDIVTKGPKTRYELPDGSYETLAENPKIRRFVWEHLQRDNKILQVLKTYGVTVSGPKMTIAQEAGMIVGNKCTYEGRVPDESKVKKIVDWPEPRNVSEVRGFLGTASVLRIFIQDYGRIARPLTDLTRKNVEFHWNQEHTDAMNALKDKIVNCPALRPIDYQCDRAVILAVDSSIIGFGYILFQEGADGRRYPNRFGSGTWNTRESHYSQAKIELYGLFRTLRAVRVFIIGVKNLIVEVDAKYIKGMINNPDIQPNATINRWIAGILLFQFKLVHVPGARHHGADGMSRRRRGEGEAEGGDEDEEWLDEAYRFWAEGWEIWEGSMQAKEVLAMEGRVKEEGSDEPRPPTTDRRERQELRLEAVKEFLQSLERPKGMTDGEYKQLVRQALEYFVRDGKLWRKSPDGKHRIVPARTKRTGLMAMAHDDLGHKGAFAVKEHLRRQFWWPGMEQDVKWFVRTCHDCQTRQYKLQRLPPVVATPAPLFHKVFIDTMLMPPAEGYKYIIQARDSLTSWAEWRPLRAETARTVQNFIFEEIFCRWGPVYEIVTDNGKPFVAEAVTDMYKRYKVHPIRISAYNSQANGAVERRHRDVREAIMKMVKGDTSKWPSVVHAVFWAERITVQKATGMSPYEMAHGVEPILPFDLAEATYMVPAPSNKLSSADLLAIQAKQLLKRPKDLRRAHERILKARNAGAREFEKRFQHTISTRVFQPGELVLVRNTRVEKELNKKTKPRYLGPYVVLRRTVGGSYILAELDGAVSRARIGAFRVVPYFAREAVNITPEELTEMTKAELDDLAETEEEEEEEDDPEGGADEEGPIEDSDSEGTAMEEQDEGDVRSGTARISDDEEENDQRTELEEGGGSKQGKEGGDNGRRMVLRPRTRTAGRQDLLGQEARTEGYTSRTASIFSFLMPKHMGGRAFI